MADSFKYGNNKQNISFEQFVSKLNSAKAKGNNFIEKLINIFDTNNNGEIDTEGRYGLPSEEAVSLFNALLSAAEAEEKDGILSDTELSAYFKDNLTFENTEERATFFEHVKAFFDLFEPKEPAQVWTPERIALNRTIQEESLDYNLKGYTVKREDDNTIAAYDGTTLVERKIHQFGTNKLTVIKYKNSAPVETTEMIDGLVMRKTKDGITSEYIYHEATEENDSYVEIRRSNNESIIVSEVDRDGNFTAEDFIYKEFINEKGQKVTVQFDNQGFLFDTVEISGNERLSTYYKTGNIFAYPLVKDLNNSQTMQILEKDNDYYYVYYTEDGNTVTHPSAYINCPSKLVKKFGFDSIEHFYELNPHLKGKATLHITDQVIVPGHLSVMSKEILTQGTERTETNKYIEYMNNRSLNEIKRESLTNIDDATFKELSSIKGFEYTPENVRMYMKFNALDKATQRKVLDKIKDYIKYVEKKFTVYDIKKYIFDNVTQTIGGRKCAVNLFDGFTISCGHVSYGKVDNKEVSIEECLTKYFNLDITKEPGKSIYEKLINVTDPNTANDISVMISIILQRCSNQDMYDWCNSPEYQAQYNADRAKYGNNPKTEAYYNFIMENPPISKSEALAMLRSVVNKMTAKDPDKVTGIPAAHERFINDYRDAYLREYAAGMMDSLYTDSENMLRNAQQTKDILQPGFYILDTKSYNRHLEAEAVRDAYRSSAYTSNRQFNKVLGRISTTDGGHSSLEKLRRLYPMLCKTNEHIAFLQDNPPVSDYPQDSRINYDAIPSPGQVATNNYMAALGGEINYRDAMIGECFGSIIKDTERYIENIGYLDIGTDIILMMAGTGFMEKGFTKAGGLLLKNAGKATTRMVRAIKGTPRLVNIGSKTVNIGMSSANFAVWEGFRSSVAYLTNGIDEKALDGTTFWDNLLHSSLGGMAFGAFAGVWGQFVTTPIMDKVLAVTKKAVANLSQVAPKVAKLVKKAIKMLPKIMEDKDVFTSTELLTAFNEAQNKLIKEVVSFGSELVGFSLYDLTTSLISGQDVALNEILSGQAQNLGGFKLIGLIFMRRARGGRAFSAEIPKGQELTFKRRGDGRFDVIYPGENGKKVTVNSYDEALALANRHYEDVTFIKPLEKEIAENGNRLDIGEGIVISKTPNGFAIELEGGKKVEAENLRDVISKASNEYTLMEYDKELVNKGEVELPNGNKFNYDKENKTYSTTFNNETVTGKSLQEVLELVRIKEFSVDISARFEKGQETILLDSNTFIQKGENGEYTVVTIDNNGEIRALTGKSVEKLLTNVFLNKGDFAESVPVHLSRQELFERVNSLEPEKMSVLEQTLGKKYFDEIKWEELIPENATPEDIARIMTELNESAKYFSRISLNEQKYGKNFEWAKKVSSIADKAVVRISQGGGIDDVLAVIAEEYRNLDSREMNGLDEVGRLREDYVDDGHARLKGDVVTTRFSKEKNWYGEYADRLASVDVFDGVGDIHRSRIEQCKYSAWILDGVIHSGSVHDINLFRSDIRANYEKLQPLFEKVKNGEALSAQDLETAHNNIAELYYRIANFCPYERGTNGIADVFIRSMYKALNIDMPALKEGVSLDLEAFCVTLEDYKKNWRTFFEDDISKQFTTDDGARRVSDNDVSHIELDRNPEIELNTKLAKYFENSNRSVDTQQMLNGIDLSGDKINDMIDLIDILEKNNCDVQMLNTVIDAIKYKQKTPAEIISFIENISKCLEDNKKDNIQTEFNRNLQRIISELQPDTDLDRLSRIIIEYNKYSDDFFYWSDLIDLKDEEFRRWINLLDKYSNDSVALVALSNPTGYLTNLVLNASDEAEMVTRIKSLNNALDLYHFAAGSYEVALNKIFMIKDSDVFGNVVRLIELVSQNNPRGKINAKDLSNQYIYIVELASNNQQNTISDNITKRKLFDLTDNSELIIKLAELSDEEFSRFKSRGLDFNIQNVEFAKLSNEEFSRFKSRSLNFSLENVDIVKLTEDEYRVYTELEGKVTNEDRIKFAKLSPTDFELVKKYKLYLYQYDMTVALINKGEAYIEKASQRNLFDYFNSRIYQFTENESDFLVDLSDEDFNIIKERNLTKPLPKHEYRGSTISELLLPDQIMMLAKLSEKDWERAKILLNTDRGQIDPSASDWNRYREREVMPFSVNQVMELLNLTNEELDFLRTTGALEQLSMDGIRMLNDFKQFLDVSDISKLSPAEYRLYAKWLTKSNGAIWQDDVQNFMLNNYENCSVFPRNKNQYCSLLSTAVSRGVREVNPLSREQLDRFENTLSDLGKENSAFLNTDFDAENFELELEYPRDTFMRDVWLALQGLPETEKQKIMDYYGFEIYIKDGAYAMSGYPSVLKSMPELTSVQGKRVGVLVERFTNKNKISVKDNPELSRMLNDIFDTFPELKGIIGKVQHGTHDYTVDVHTLKVLQGVISNPEFNKLSNKDKKMLTIATLMHDISKKENEVDKQHPQNSATEAYQLLAKMDLTEEERDGIYKIVKYHDWLERYNKAESDEARTIVVHEIAYALKDGNNFKLASILTEADLKGVQKNNAFFARYSSDLQKGIEEIGEVVNYLKSTAIYLPQTRLPKASEVKVDGYIIEERVMNGHKVRILHLRKGQDLSQVGFPKGTMSDDVLLLYHGFSSESGLYLLKSFDDINSDAVTSNSLLSTYAPEVYAPFGVINYVNNSQVIVGYHENIGSGYGGDKIVSNIIESRLYGMPEVRSYFSDKIKEKLNLNDAQYIALYDEVSGMTMTELRQSKPDVANAMDAILYETEMARRQCMSTGFNGQRVTEIVVERPSIQGVGCPYGSAELDNMPEYLSKLASEEDILIVCVEND